MATEVTLKTGCLHVKRGGITLRISDTNKGSMGRLTITNGSLTWFPDDKQKGYVFTWKELGDFAVINGKQQK